MPRFSCPVCGYLFSARMERARWMRMIPSTKAYHCTHCKNEFLAIGSLIKFQLNPPHDRGLSNKRV